MAEGAAFFDLDRTLLAGASGPVLTEALRNAGVVSGRTLPGEGLVYKVFDTIGETLPSMALARQAAALSKGRVRAKVQAAATEAADVLVGMIQPFAKDLFAEHRAAGRRLVLATTTPYDMVKPLADALGFDDVVATRYGVNADGTYDGSIVGPFVWAAGKLEAVRAWAKRNGVDLAESWFYSDSVYDTPLLSAVGHPVVVNPDPRMVFVAMARRWPRVHLDVPRGVPKLPIVNLEPQQVAMAFARPELVPYARFDIAGAELIPKEGPAIVVGNHRSYFDATAMSILFGRAGRTVRFLGKKEVFDAPVVGWAARAFGGIRVDRGTGSDEPLQEAAARARSRPGRGHHAAGHHPARPGLLRPCAEGALGRRPPGAPHQGTGHPRRPVGHREGVAPQQPAAERASTSPTRRSCASASAHRWR